MKRSERNAEWFFLLLKRQLKKPWFYLLTGLLLLFLYIFQEMVLPGDSILMYGIMNDGAICGEEVISFLKQDTLYTAVEMNSLSSLERGVESGRLDCGFVLTDKLDRALGADIPGESIHYYCTTSTASGSVLREKVLAAVLRETTRQMLAVMASPEETPAAAEAGLSLFTEEARQDEGLRQDLLSTYQEYLDGDETIHTVFETVSVGQETIDAKKYPNDMLRLRALIGILVFASSIVFGRLRFSPESSSFASAQRRKGARMWRFLEILVPVLLVTVVLWIPFSYRLASGQYGITDMVLSILQLLLCACASSIWSFIFSSLYRNESWYTAAIPVVIMFAVITNSTLTGFLSPGRVLEVIGYLFPSGYL